MDAHATASVEAVVEVTAATEIAVDAPAVVEAVVDAPADTEAYMAGFGLQACNPTRYRAFTACNPCNPATSCNPPVTSATPPGV